MGFGCGKVSVGLWFIMLVEILFPKLLWIAVCEGTSIGW